jgi:hypothetical protein
LLKGTVQQKLTGVESDINRKVFLSHWTADISFLNFQGACSLNSKKTVSAAKAKICGLSNSMGRPLQITDSGKPIQIHSWSFSRISRWKPILWFIAAIGSRYWLIVEIGVPLIICFILQREAYSRYRHNSGKPISAVSWLAYRYLLFAAGAPLNWISRIFWLKPLKPAFSD